MSNPEQYKQQATNIGGLFVIYIFVGKNEAYENEMPFLPDLSEFILGGA